MTLRDEDAALLIAETHSDATVLIGGQAVAFWSRYFDITPRLPALTEDIDYLGTKAEARRVSARLKIRHKLQVATIDDYTPNSAVLAVDMEGYPQPVLIDYLASIVGLNSKDIHDSAALVEFEGQRLRVVHPLQLLQSKIWNLHALPAKRTPEGVEQARLAIEIAAAFIAQAGMTQRELLDAIEAVAKFAATTPARFVAEKYQLDCLSAIPNSVFDNGVLPDEFHQKRWPQLVAATR